MYLWKLIPAFFQPGAPETEQSAALDLVGALIEGQYDRLGMLRKHIFELVHSGLRSRHHTGVRLALLRKLTRDGRDLTHFEMDIGRFLLEWLVCGGSIVPTNDNINVPVAVRKGRGSSVATADSLGDNKLLLLSFITLVVKYNFSFCPDDVLEGLVWETCRLCNVATDINDVECCLSLLDMFMRFGYIPLPCLPDFVGVLCRTVNIERFCHISWTVMKNVLKSHLGHTTMRVMCDTIQDSKNKSTINLLRGSVFFLGMATWGSQRIHGLQITYSTILPALIKVLDFRQPVVAYELVLSISRLVKKFGVDLRSIDWELVMDIINKLDSFRAFPGADHVGPGGEFSDSSLDSVLDGILTTMEELYVQNRIHGSPKRLFALFESFGLQRPESSIIVLLNYKALELHPAVDGWLVKAHDMMCTYYRKEVRTKVRMKALSILGSIVSSSCHIYEEVINVIVVPFLIECAVEEDPVIRSMAVDLVVDIASGYHTRQFNELLSILDEVLEVGLDRARTGDAELNESTLSALRGIISLFKSKLHHIPSAHTLRVFEVLIHHASVLFGSFSVSRNSDESLLYGNVSGDGSDCDSSTRLGNDTLSTVARMEITSCLFSLRADDMHHIYLSPLIDPATGHPLDVDTLDVDSIRTSPSSSVRFHSSDDIDKTSTEQSAGSSAYVMCRNSSTLTKDASVSEIPSATITLQVSNILELAILCIARETHWITISTALINVICMLKNRHIMWGSGQVVRKLCTVICRRMSDRKLLENVIDIGERTDRYVRARMLACRALTCFVSLKALLTRNELELLIKTFEYGLQLQADQGPPIACVQALTLCMLELEVCAVKFLPSLLFRLSQIASTPTMAVYILEFLSCVVSLSHLYVNFVEEDYKRTFGIALRYLNSGRHSVYVRSLAFRVLTLWFVRLRLTDRRKFIPFILRNLFTDQRDDVRATTHKGGGSGQESDATLCEWADVSMDMLSRYSHARCSSELHRAPVTDFLLRDASEQHWLLGDSIVTVRITTTGWAEVITRKSTGMLSWVMRFENKDYYDPFSLLSSPIGLLLREDQHDMDLTGSQPQFLFDDVDTTSDVKRHNQQRRGKPLIQQVHKATIGESSSTSTTVAGHSTTATVAASSATATISANSFIEASDSNDNLDGGNATDNVNIRSTLFRNLALRSVNENVLHSRKAPCRSISVPTLASSWVSSEPIVHPEIEKLDSNDRELIEECQSSATLMNPSLVSPQTTSSLLDSMSNSPLFYPSLALASGNELIGPIDDDTSATLLNQSSDRMNLRGKSSSIDYNNELNDRVENIGVESECVIDKNIVESRKNSIIDKNIVESRKSSTSLAHIASLDTGIMYEAEESSEDIQSSNISPMLSPRTSTRLRNHKDTLAFPVQSSTGESDTTLSSSTTLLDEADNNETTYAVNCDYFHRNEGNNDSCTNDLQLSPLCFGTQVSTGVPLSDSSLSVAVGEVDANPEASSNDIVTASLSYHLLESVTIDDTKKSIVEDLENDCTDASSDHKLLSLDRGEDLNNVLSPVDDIGELIEFSKNDKNRFRASSAIDNHGLEITKKSSPYRVSRSASVPTVSHRIQGDVKLDMSIDNADLPRVHNLDRGMRPLSAAVSSAVSINSDASQSSPVALAVTQRTEKCTHLPSGITNMLPSFVFMQLHQYCLDQELPVTVTFDEPLKRALSVLDRVPTYDTHKIGVVYVGKGHNSEADILSNTHGSMRYQTCLSNMGRLIRLNDDTNVYTGGLDRTNGMDGEFALSYQDDVTQVIFHVATLMPTRSADSKCQNKKLHIGNNYVTVVYDDSGLHSSFSTLHSGSQFNTVDIVIRPSYDDVNEVSVHSRREAALLPHLPVTISDHGLGVFVRQLALHLNLLCHSQSPMRHSDCNWIERLRQIRRIRARVPGAAPLVSCKHGPKHAAAVLATVATTYS